VRYLREASAPVHRVLARSLARGNAYGSSVVQFQDRLRQHRGIAESTIDQRPPGHAPPACARQRTAKLASVLRQHLPDERRASPQSLSSVGDLAHRDRRCLLNAPIPSLTSSSALALTVRSAIRKAGIDPPRHVPRVRLLT